jgi:eukaryotic-like serine/threonine-protein kinase
MSDDAPSFAERASRFQFRRRLGEGAFGVVWEVYDQRREARVALKELVRTDPAALLRFKREFRALTDLVHPNLVTLYELLSVDDQWFFTMEFVDGTDFIRHVTGRADPWALTEEGPVEGTMLVDVNGGSAVAPTRISEDPSRAPALSPRLHPAEPPEPQTMSTEGSGAITPPELLAAGAMRTRSRDTVCNPERVRAATRQLALGLSALHDALKLHRDIKPSNVLVTADGRVVVLDFGLIADLPPEGLTEGSRAVVGTPGFMSPEQALGRALSPATDWYGVGAMLYVAMTGRMPWSGTPLQILLSQQQRDPTPPSEFVTGVPPDLESLCLDLLRREPEARPSAAEVLARLGGPDTMGMSLPPPTTRRTPFVGRRAHLDTLREAYALTEGGRAAVALVYGGSGLGKTTLVRRFLHEIRTREHDAVILAGRCYEREAVPYKALDNLVDELSLLLRRLDPEDAAALMPRGVEALARLFPVLRHVDAVASPQQPGSPIADPLEFRRRAFSAMRDLLARLAGTRPVVLAIDDLQWSDADSDALLATIVRAPAPPLLLIATYRLESIAESPLRLALSASVEGEPPAQLRELHVTEFTPAEAYDLATALLGFGEIQRAQAIVAESAGNPLFIEALVQHLALSPSPIVPPPATAAAEEESDAHEAPDVRVADEAPEPHDLGAAERAPDRARAISSLPGVTTPPRTSSSPPAPTLASGVLSALPPPLDPAAAPSIGRIPAPPPLPGMGGKGRGARHVDLAEMIQARVAQLPEASRALLEVIVVAGRPLDITVAARAAGITSFDPTSFSQLLVTHLAKSRPLPSGAVEAEAYHDRVREHALAQLPPERVRSYHAALAAALEAAGSADPEVLAAHHEAAGQRDQAMAYARSAAEAAERALAFDRAARLYEAALRHSLAPPRELFLRLAEARVNAGHGARAADAFLEAARFASGAELIDLRRRAAEQLLLSGHVDRGLELFRLVLAPLGMSIPGSSPAALVSYLFRSTEVRIRGLRFEERQATPEELQRIDACWAVSIGLSLVDTFRGADFQARHLLLALRAGEPYRLARALSLEVPYSAAGGTRTRVRTEHILDLATSLAARIDNPHALGLTRMARGTAHFLVGEWKEAFESASASVALFRERCVGVAWEIVTAEVFALTSLMSLGRYGELTERAQEDLRSAAARGDLHASTQVNLVVGWCIDLAADAPMAARARLDESFPEHRRASFGTEHVNHLYASANVHLYLGEAEAAHALLARCWGDLRRSFTLQIQNSRIDMLDLRARAAVGWAMAGGTSPRRRRALLAAVERDLDAIEAERVAWGAALARLGRSSLALARGARAEARYHAAAAESALHECHMEAHAAVARRRAGELAPGAEGRALVDSADLRLYANGVKNPARLAAMLMPSRD